MEVNSLITQLLCVLTLFFNFINNWIIINLHLDYCTMVCVTLEILQSTIIQLDTRGSAGHNKKEKHPLMLT